MTVKHTTACLTRQREWEEWREAHPDYCRTCEGDGFFYTPQTWEEPESVDSCPTCYDEALCPWCGAIMFQIQNDEGNDCQYCTECKWTDADWENLPCVPHAECECWMIDEYEGEHPF